MIRSERAFVAGVILFSTLITQAAQASPARDGLRLIETEPGKKTWMNPAQIQKLSDEAHQQGFCGGFMDVTEHPDAPHIAILPFSTFRTQLQPRLGAVVEPLLRELSLGELQSRVVEISTFPTRHHRTQDAVRAIDAIEQKFRQYAGRRTDVTYERVPHRFVMPSLIVRIQGAGTEANERVILGAHGDSIVQGMLGFPGGESATSPGADDDASGVATLLEVFRVLTAGSYRPNRTVEFMVYAGEEGGLLGSQDIAQRYRAEGRQVSAVLQLDMTMYPGKINPAITLITDNVDASLTQFLKQLITTYVKAPYREATLGRFAASDHVSWTKAGFPAAFPTEATLRSMNPAIHTSRDTVHNLDFTYGMHFARLALAFAVESAGAQ
jgi:leucyl aminopeptidase